MSFNRLLFFVGICRKYSFLFAIVFGLRLSPISLHGILVFLSTACLADSLLYHVDFPDCCICLVVQQVHYERYQSVRCGRDVVQTHRSTTGFLGTFYFPNRRKSSLFLPCSSSQRIICFVMMLLPQLRSMLVTSRIRMRCTKEMQSEGLKKSFPDALNQLLVGSDVFSTWTFNCSLKYVV